MRTQRRAVSSVWYSQPPNSAPRADLPVEIAFLAGQVDESALAAAASVSHRSAVCAAQVLIAEEWVSAPFYYQALARHLGLAFDDTWPMLDRDVDVRVALQSGWVEVFGAGGPHWLHAPQGDDLKVLLSGRLVYLDRAKTAITTPFHLAALLQCHAQDAVETIATHELPSTLPRLSAKGALDLPTFYVAAVLIALGIEVGYFEPRIGCALFGLLFFGGIALRLLAAAASFVRTYPPPSPLSDAELPKYTVLVPLHREAEVVPDLLVALSALDYPRAKLEVLILIEPEDHSTRGALAAARLPPWIQVVFAPRKADLRTKPRALNIGLLIATGELLTVYDAEDRPDPDQLRLAAAAFHSRPDLTCLQARIGIDNGDASAAARLFALEYAALFDVLNVGTTRLRLPLALGGTSNHVRCATLRSVGGWDAWNVTEDADLGLRLARLGYKVGDLASTTWEAGPDKWAVWFRQRRRWTKGWMQTFLVIARDAPNAARDLGVGQAFVLTLLLLNMAIGPLCLPAFYSLTAYRLATYGVPTPHGGLELFEATVSAAVIVYGLASTFWVALVGMKRRGLMRFLPSIPLLLPYQVMISGAALFGLFDLIRSPYHWHKTPHGRHRRASTGDAIVRCPASQSER